MLRWLPTDTRWRWLAWSGYVLAGIALALLVLLGSFPLGAFKPTLERKLTERFGRPVTVGSLERQGAWSLTPTVAIRDIRVPQPDWAGAGDLARIDLAVLRFGIAALLRGQISPHAVTVRGARLSLVRRADGRENWHGDARDTPSDETPAIDRLVIEDTILSYRDAKQDRAVVLRIASDPTRGFRADGRGSVRGATVAVAITGGAIGPRRGARWPFRASIDGPALAMTARGTMASPLDTNHMALDVTARATDLKLIDAVIEAGLFRTQPVTLRAHVDHDRPRWRITGLTGTIGRSRLSGALSVDKVAGRTKLNGDLRFAALSFADLASDEGLAQAKAKERAIGPRVVPDTRINIRKIDSTDLTMRVRADRILSDGGSSPFRSLRATLTLDRRRLVVRPLRVALAQGAITGRAVVDQRGGAAEPVVTLDLALRDSSLAAVSRGGSVSGRVDARVLLTGRGSTIREAVGASSGRIGFVARNGALPARIASALGSDAGRALLTDDDARAGLRCAILGLRVRGGVGTVDRLVIDTTQGQTRGTGTVRFPAETLALTLSGTPKRDAMLRIPGSATMTGTISAPAVKVPPQVRSAGNILKAIGRAITGHQGPVAGDADCGTLAAGVLR